MEMWRAGNNGTRDRKVLKVCHTEGKTKELQQMSEGGMESEGGEAAIRNTQTKKLYSYSTANRVSTWTAQAF